MRILILGGTWFVGRAVANAALAAGHEVAVFNRGRSGVDPAGVVALRGDRESASDMRRVADAGPWDAVIDTSGQVPRIVQLGAAALAPVSGRYVYFSSVSAYVGWPVDALTEESELLECPPSAGPTYGEDDPRGYPTNYGFQKAGCEAAVREQFGEERAMILRPGVILGPEEYVGRLPWWLRRVLAGGRVAGPGDPNRTIQPVDVRDVAEFALRIAEVGPPGAFNVTAPEEAATFGSFLEACVRESGSDARLDWMPDNFLIEQGVRQWTGLPMWRVYDGVWNVSSAKAREAGLRTRPLEQTVADTWTWLRNGGQPLKSERAAELGITSEQESALFQAWDQRTNG